MKPTAFILALIVCMGLPAPGSSEGLLSLYEEPSMALGFKAGIGFTGVHGRGVDELIGNDTKGKSGFIGGMFFRITISRHASFQPELLYAIKGDSRDGAIIDTVSKVPRYGTVKTQLTYMEIPLLVRIRLRYGPGWVPAVYGGPVVSILQTAKIVFEDGDTFEFEIDDAVTKTDLGVVLGGGVNFPFGTGYLTTEIRYTLGMNSIDQSGLGRDVYNHSLSFMAGFMFPLKRMF